MGGKETENSNNSYEKLPRCKAAVGLRCSQQSLCFIVFLNVQHVDMLMEMIQQK